VIGTVGGTPAALVAKAATATIPIVFALGGDPVRLGLLAALNRPGGNITGVTVMSEELAPKLLELLHELAPNDLEASLLINSTNPLNANEAERVKEAARNLGLKLNVLGARDDQELEQDFVSLSKARAGGLVIAADTFFISRMK
jgi:putative tryptophan/tyrosine transport system substrate-binding protein